MSWFDDDEKKNTNEEEKPFVFNHSSDTLVIDNGKSYNVHVERDPDGTVKSVVKTPKVFGIF